MSDICERLRREIVWEQEVGGLLAEAADEIEMLRNCLQQWSKVTLDAKDLAMSDKTGHCPAPDNAAKQDTLTAEEREVLGNVADDARYRGLGWTEQVVRGLLERLGGCTPQLDCGADRKSVASQRCRDTGGQPFDSAPTTTLTNEERECLEWAEELAGNCEEFGRVDTLRGLLERLGGGE